MTTSDSCKKTLYDDLFLLLSSMCVIQFVLPVSYLLVSYFVMNFLRRIFLVCHSFRSMCQSGRMKGFERCFKVEDQGTWRRQNLHAVILRPPAKRIWISEALWAPFGERKSLRVLDELHLGKEKPVMENIEPLLRITKPAEGLNKPSQGNVNGRKSFAAEGFKLNVKIPFISQTYTKGVAISFRQSHTRTRNLVKYHPRVAWIRSQCTHFRNIKQYVHLFKQRDLVVKQTFQKCLRTWWNWSSMHSDI